MSSTGMTPQPCCPTLTVLHMPAVDQQLGAQDEFIIKVRDCLVQAQQQYKAAYDKNHRPLTFEVGDWVWLQLLHWPVASLSVHSHGELSPRFYGSFQVVECIRSVAYKL
jgi:hypothetical protein